VRPPVPQESAIAAVTAFADRLAESRGTDTHDLDYLLADVDPHTLAYLAGLLVVRTGESGRRELRRLGIAVARNMAKAEAS
jgi:hypothetical protein